MAEQVQVPPPSPAVTDQPLPGPDAHAAAAHHGDSTTILGRTLPVPIYTVIFGILAVVTLIEVVISELPEGVVGNLLLVGLSGVKAALVVWYYMHLREDGLLYTMILIVPVVLVIIATWFLTSVPLGNY
jgi:caa(3)-type oxidase subunit IV